MNPARAAFLLFLVMLFLSATAAVPRLLTVQGRLKEAGSAVSGNYDITFYIYNTESGGSPLYTEAHTGANAVPVSAGFFSVVLGEITPLDLPFKEQYWLALKVGSDAEMAPRIKLTNSSYAFVARDLNVASNLNIDSGTLYVDIGNNRVGIGTTSPSYKLQVEDAGNTVELKVVADSTHPAILSAVGGTSGTLELRDLGGGADATRKLIRSDGGKLYFYKTDDAWGVETAQMVIDNSGNVGIGTTSPAELLHVGTGAHGDVIQIGSYTALGEDYSSAATILGDNVKPIGYGTSGMEIITTHSSCGARAIQMRSGQGITFHTLSGSVTAGDTFSSERMRITDTGNVGIGTTNPTYDLHVTGSDEPVAMVNIDTGSTNSMVSALLLQADTSGNMANGFGPNLWFSIKDVVPSSIAKIGAVRDGADSSGMLKFGTYNSGSYNTNMVIDHSGNVGIGTTSPGQLLELQKNSEGNLIYGLKLVNNGASTDTVNTATGILFGTGYSAQTSTRGKGALVYATTGGYNVGDFHFLQNSVADGSIATLSDSVMTIKNNGNVGIGTTSPGEKLEINGNMKMASGGQIKFEAGDFDPYFIDSWGVEYQGDATHPMQVRGTSLLVGYDATGGSYSTSGNLLVNGNVGIGTTSPGAKLHVEGGEIIQDESSSFKVKKIVKSWSAPGTGWHTFYTANQYEGYSLYANVLYENDAGDAGDRGAIFHMAYYGHASQTATRISGSTSLEIQADTSGNFQVRHSSGGTGSSQHLTIYAEIVTKS